jgi:hypothetical protein
MASMKYARVRGLVRRFVPGEGRKGQHPDLIELYGSLRNAFERVVGILRDYGAAVEEDLREKSDSGS